MAVFVPDSQKAAYRAQRASGNAAQPKSVIQPKSANAQSFLQSKVTQPVGSTVNEILANYKKDYTSKNQSAWAQKYNGADYKAKTDALYTQIQNMPTASSQQKLDRAKAEAEYDWLKSYVDYSDAMNFDIKAGEQRVKDLDDAVTDFLRQQHRQNLNGGVSSAEARKANREKVAGLKQERAKAQVETERARHTQLGEAYYQLQADPQFAHFAQQGKSSEDNKRLSSSGKNSDRFALMNKEEQTTYDYLLGKYGKEQADKYFDFLGESLNERLGRQKAEEIDAIDSDFLQTMAAGGYELLEGGKGVFRNLKAGVQDFFGVPELETTAGDYAVQYINQDLAEMDTGLNALSKGDRNVSTVWADLMYQIGRNFTPALVGRAIDVVLPGAGTVVAKGVFATDVYESAKKEAMQRGYAEGNARVYAALNTASELGLESVLGGIAELRAPGMASLHGWTEARIQNLGKAFWRAAATTAVDSAGEAIEEGLQEIITPIFRNIALGEELKIDGETFDNAAYSALIGALMVIPGQGRQHRDIRNTEQVGAYIRAFRDVNPETYNLYMKEALSSENSDIRELAENLESGKYKSNNGNVGNLAIMMADSKKHDVIENLMKDAADKLCDINVGKYVQMAQSDAEAQYEKVVAENPGMKVFNPVQMKLHEVTGWDAKKTEEQAHILSSIFSGIAPTNADIETLDTSNPGVQAIVLEYSGVDISDGADVKAKLLEASSAAAETQTYQEALRDVNRQIVSGYAQKSLDGKYAQQISDAREKAMRGTGLTVDGVRRGVIPAASQYKKSTAKSNTQGVAKSTAAAYTGTKASTIGNMKYDHDTFIKKFMERHDVSEDKAEAEWRRIQEAEGLLYNKPQPTTGKQGAEPVQHKKQSKPKKKADVKEIAENGRSTGDQVRSDNSVRGQSLADGGSISEVQSGDAGPQQTSDPGRGGAEAAQSRASAPDVHDSVGEVTPEHGYIEAADYDERQRKFVDDLKADGFDNVTLAYGELRNDAGQNVDAVIRGGDMTIRWDMKAADVQQIADHERIHRWIKAVHGKDPAKRKEFVIRTLHSAASETALRDIYSRYYDTYSKAYDAAVESDADKFGKELADGYLEGLIYEEILCDMYAHRDYNGAESSRYTYKVKPLIEMSGIREQALNILGVADTKAQPAVMSEAQIAEAAPSHDSTEGRAAQDESTSIAAAYAEKRKDGESGTSKTTYTTPTPPLPSSDRKTGITGGAEGIVDESSPINNTPNVSQNVNAQTVPQVNNTDRISDTVEKAIANKGDLQKNKRPVKIGSISPEVVNMVFRASSGKIDISGKTMSLYADDIWHAFKRHSDGSAETSRDQVALTKEDLTTAISAINDPDIVECVFSDVNNPTQKQAFVYVKQASDGNFVIVETVGGKNNPNIFPVEIIKVTPNKWSQWFGRGKTIGEMLYENDSKKLAALDVAANKRNRVIAAQYASKLSPASSAFSSVDHSLTHNREIINPQIEKPDSAPYVSDNGYTLIENPERASVEISFSEKPDEAVRNVLKANKFRWNSKSKVWYGRTDSAAIVSALDTAYDDLKNTSAASEETSFAETFNKATREEKDEVIQAMRENMGGFAPVYPTEIRDPNVIRAMEWAAAPDTTLAPKYVIPPANKAPAKTNMEVTDNGESENGTEEGTVQQPELHAEGTSRLLEGVQTEPLPGVREGRRPAGDGDFDRRQDGRTDGEPDTAGTDAGRGARDSLGGRVQQLSGIGEEQSSDKEAITPEKQAEVLRVEVSDEIDRRSKTSPKGSNFVIGEGLDLPSSTKPRVRANLDAIKLVKRLASENRYATEEEQEVLSKYVGWGGLPDAFGKPVVNRETRRTEYTSVKGLETEFEELKELLTEEEYKAARESTQNAHYTSIEVVKAMYDGLKHLGFEGGRMLEPASGTGNFVGAMPADMSASVKSWTMVELDSTTGLIAKYLYPNADVRIQGFEEANIPDNYMDVAIGNVPFGNYSILDKHYPSAVTNAIHNYFFAKSLDKVRPGGLCMFITSSYTMGSRDNAVRKYIMERADLLGAIRLPNTAFLGNAGTSVVTDILILKKRAPRTAYSGEVFETSNWTTLDKGGHCAYVNEYFTAHPEMVLGTPNFNGHGLYGRNELTYDPLVGKGTLGDQIRGAMQTITGRMEYALQPTPEESNTKAAGAKKKKRMLQIESDGKIISRDEKGNTYEVKADTATGKRISGMVEIRDAYSALCDALQQGQDRKTIQQLRKTLNKTYDGYVAKYGFLNSSENRAALREFADQYSLLSLENYDAKTRKATKTDIFTKDTIKANVTVETAEDVASGLTVSLNTKGAVDVEYIAKLTADSAENVSRQLVNQRLAFKDRDGNLVPAVKYLSGNVRAKLREMEGLVGIDPDYQNNVEALREVVPETVPYTDIFVNPGANWVPTSVYEDFVSFILNRTNYRNYRTGKKDFSVEYVAEANEYKVTITDAYAYRSAENTQVWGEGGKNFSTIFENMLNGRRTNVYATNAAGDRVLDKVQTEAVAEKVEKLNEEFRKWLWSDDTRRDEMQELYNQTFNALVTPKYDGSSLTVNGLNSSYTLRSHQADAVERVVTSGGNTLLAHRVGAGKTMEMAAAAMKLKQLGVIKKPMFVVPNNVVAQWGKEFKDYFPAANILVVGDSDMTPSERMTTINKIKNNEYDAVILAYTKFEAIPMTQAWREKFYQEQIDDIIFAISAEKERSGKSFSVKQLEKKRKQLETKIKKLTDTKKDEDGAMFEDLGVDSLFVDEAHNFKNLEYTTRMSNVAGLGSTDGSQRAFDLYTKIRYLQQLNGGRGIVFATATPVMNSMTEMYIMQRYLQPDTLIELGIDSFDAWAKMFGEVVNALEIAPSGSGYRVKQTFSKFKNVRALQQLFRNFTDVVTDIPGLKIPKMKGGKVQIVECQPSDFQKEYMQTLAKRAENVKNVDPSEDNMLKITSDGRKISYSQRMIDPSLPYEENGKVFMCCENVYKVYRETNQVKGTQMIFCDMATPRGKSSVKKGKARSQAAADINDEFGGVDLESAKLYDDIKGRLVELGIPAKEIAFIHEAKNDKQKSALADRMNSGEIRVLIGSTGKMGVGLNAQQKAAAIHHLDAPWRPGDIEQRDGRVFRQKNENSEAYKFVYVTKGSFDSRLWDILERKQKFISQIMNGENVGNEVEDTGEVTLSAAEVKAVASDNPLILEQVKLEKDISKLESLEKAHQTNVSRAKEKRVLDQRKVAEYSDLTEKLRKDISARKDTYSSDAKFSMTIGDRVYTKKSNAGIALINEARNKAVEGSYTNIGKFAGFDLKVISAKEGIRGVISGYGDYSFNTYPGNTSYGIAHVISIVEGFEERLNKISNALREAESDLAAQIDIINSPFTEAEQLREKRGRLGEIMDILNPPVEQQINETDVEFNADGEESYAVSDPLKQDILDMIAAADNDPSEFTRIVEEWAEMYAKAPASKAQQQSAEYVIPPVKPISETKQQANREQLNDLIERYGSMPTGENPERDFIAPARKDDGTYVRRFARTAAEASGTPDSMLSQIEQQILSDAGSYVRISDAKAIAFADKEFAKPNGYQRVKDAWNSSIANPDINLFPTKEQVALGEKLYIESASIGDVSQTFRTLADLSAMATQAGQIVQAMRMLKKMGPSGQLYYVQKAVDRLNKQFEQSLAKAGQTITINQDLAEGVMLAGEDVEAMNEAMDALIQDIADQVPVTLKDKLDAWRYLGMLGNARTHIRNILGNVVFVPTRFTKDILAAVGEQRIDPAQRTKSVDVLLNPTKYKAARAFAAADFEACKAEITGNGKYNPTNDILQRRRVFKSEMLNKLSEKNSALLEAEDAIFLRKAYISAMTQFLAARGVDIESPDAKVLNEARQYATLEAQKATYRDASAVASALNKLARMNKGWALGLDAVLPFKKTPVNILKRGIEYSPVGLIKSATYGLYRLRSGKITAAEFVDSLASGMTGTMVAALGAWLAAAGIARGPGDDDKEGDLESTQGRQDYSIEIGDMSFTIDWLAPVSLPFFVGVQAYNLYKDKNDMSLWRLAESLSLIAEPMLSLSMLDGINNIVESAAYSENDAIFSMIGSAATSYVSQFVPTLLGQFARTFDPYRRANYVDKNKSMDAKTQRFVQSIQGKIPGLANQKMAYVDLWGRKDTNGSFVLRAFENFLSPGYINRIKETPVDTELTRLAKATGKNSMMPSAVAKQFAADGKTVNLTASQYERYAISRGQMAYSLIESLINSTYYAAMDDNLRAKTIETALKYATSVAKTDIISDYAPDTKWMARAAEAGYAEEAILYQSLASYTGITGNDLVAQLDGIGDEARGYLILATYSDQSSITDPSRKGYRYTLDDTGKARLRELYSAYFWPEYADLMLYDGRYVYGDLETRVALLKKLGENVRKEARTELASELRAAGFISEHGDAEIESLDDYLNW